MVLTGDKKETAVHIAQNSGIVRSNFKLLRLDDTAKCDEELQKHIDRVKQDPREQYAMVIEGNFLERCVESNADAFLELFGMCKTVVCSRSAPSQKALIVDLVKSRWGKVCLAIGDGANDVSMIQQAHVGIGIRGVEGTQAAVNADYVISNFWYGNPIPSAAITPHVHSHKHRQLRRLIFIHGRFSLVRSTATVFFCFYKNIGIFTTRSHE